MEVLRTAARTFSDLGFRQATLEDVAAALGMTRPALYHYADSKDALLSACGIIARRNLSDAVVKAKAELGGWGQISTFFAIYHAITSDDFGRCFVLTGLSEMEAGERQKVRETQIVLGRSVTQMLELGVADGSIRRCDTVNVSRTLFASFNGVARWWPEREGQEKNPALPILDLFFAGLTPRPSNCPT